MAVLRAVGASFYLCKQHFSTLRRVWTPPRCVVMAKPRRGGGGGGNTGTLKACSAIFVKESCFSKTTKTAREQQLSGAMSENETSQFYCKTRTAQRAYAFLTAGGSLILTKSGWAVLTPFWPVGSCGNMMHTWRGQHHMK